MAHDTHASTEHHDGEAHPHPALPPVTDDAPDSPMWLPASGLALLALLVLFALYRAASAPDEAEVVDVAPAGDVVPAGEAAPVAAPAE